MAENDKFFQITTMPRRSGISGKLTKLYRKRQLVISVIGAYVLIGGLLGFILFNSAGERAKASDDIARVTPIIDLIDSENQSLVIGDTVEVKITLQNRSSTEAINNLAVEFFSTKNAVNWSEMRSQLDVNSAPVVGQNNVFKLPVLSSGERATYIAKGTLQNEDSNFLTILAKVRYLNIEGQQEVHSNRVFTELKGQNSSTDNLVSLTPSKDSYLPGESVALSMNVEGAVELSTDFNLKGKVYISQLNSQQITSTVDCIFANDGTCVVTTSLLNPGAYSALFISEDQKIFSDISQFQVAGSSAQTNINPQASIDFPFGSKSINGVVPVFASRVVGLNTTLKADDACVFEVLANGNIVASINAPIKPDRSCNVFINASQIPGGEGVYGVRLKGSEAVKEVSVVRKPSSLLTLQTGANAQLVGNPVDIISSTINDIAGNPITGDTVKLNILHRDTGDYQQISQINGQTLTVNNGQFSAQIPASYFEKKGLYLVAIETSNGQASDFLSISYGGNEVGMVYSGVLVDNYENLQVGKNITFSLQNITDKSGNAIQSGSCQAGIYSKSSSATPLVINGAIESGNCNVLLEAGKLTEAGPILVSFSGPEIGNDIPQSRQFRISSGVPSGYGQLNMEYEPIRQNFANTAIIGPIADAYGNITDAYGLSLDVISDNKVVKTITDVSSQGGFANITLPASVFASDNVVLKLYNSEKQELLTREFVLANDQSKLILPSVPTTVSNNTTIKLSLPAIDLAEGQTCKISTILPKGDEVSVDAVYNKDQAKCELNWDLNQNRNNGKMLVTLVANSQRYTNVISLTSGEAANLFVLSPSTRIDAKDELHINLLTSIITDKYGLPVQDGKVRVQFNGKTKEAPINNGTASMAINANDLSSKDIREVFSAKYLDLNLEANAGVLSINKTNYLTLFLDGKDIAMVDSNFKYVSAQTHITSGTSKILAFKSEICRAIIVNDDTTTVKLLKSHQQGDICYVEVSNISVPSTIVFEDKGYVVGTFDITPVFQTNSVKWCESKNCLIQVIAPLNSVVEANVYDGDSIYNFKGAELENVVKISQNGLNPLKDYLVEVTFTNSSNQKVSFFKLVKGEYLTGNN